MKFLPTSIKFTADQRLWLQAEANRLHNGRVGTMIKEWVDRKRKSSNRAKTSAKGNA